MESIFLNVAAVNTHRDRPQVAAGSLLGWWARSWGSRHSNHQGQAQLGHLLSELEFSVRVTLWPEQRLEAYRGQALPCPTSPGLMSTCPT